MKKTNKQNPDFLEYVLKLNGDLKLHDAFDLSLKNIDNLDIAQLKRIGLKTYENGKWTIHKILQHLIDGKEFGAIELSFLQETKGIFQKHLTKKSWLNIQMPMNLLLTNL